MILSRKMVESDICTKVIKSEFRIPDSIYILKDFDYKSIKFNLMLRNKDKIDSLKVESIKK